MILSLSFGRSTFEDPVASLIVLIIFDMIGIFPISNDDPEAGGDGDSDDLALFLLFGLSANPVALF